MSSFQTVSYSSLSDSMVDTSVLKCVGCVHVLIGLVTFAMGIVSSCLHVYLGWLCVGVWTGISFFVCGVISIAAGKSANILTVILVACTNVLTLNFAFMGGTLMFSSFFQSSLMNTVQSGEGPRHNQTAGIALGILHLVVTVIEIVVCVACIKISWRIFSSAASAGYRDRSGSYDDPYMSSDNFSHTSLQESRRRRTSENATPPPTYDVATHTLSTSPKSVVGASARADSYGSVTDSERHGNL